MNSTKSIAAIRPFRQRPDQPRRLIIAKPARRPPDHPGHDCGIQRIGVKADDDIAARGDQIDHGLNAVPMQLTGGHEIDAPIQRVLIILRGGGADPARADLNDARDVIHLGCATHGR